MITPSVLNRFLGGRASVLVGDLTLEATDAIVNAANATRLGRDESIREVRLVSCSGKEACESLASHRFGER